MTTHSNVLSESKLSLCLLPPIVAFINGYICTYIWCQSSFQKEKKGHHDILYTVSLEYITLKGKADQLENKEASFLYDTLLSRPSAGLMLILGSLVPSKLTAGDLLKEVRFQKHILK